LRRFEKVFSVSTNKNKKRRAIVGKCPSPLLNTSSCPDFRTRERSKKEGLNRESRILPAHLDPKTRVIGFLLRRAFHKGGEEVKWIRHLLPLLPGNCQITGAAIDRTEHHNPRNEIAASQYA
jgi:hypothetical protein